MIALPIGARSECMHALIYRCARAGRGQHQAGRHEAKPSGQARASAGLWPMPLGWWVRCAGEGTTTVERLRAESVAGGRTAWQGGRAAPGLGALGTLLSVLRREGSKRAGWP